MTTAPDAATTASIGIPTLPRRGAPAAIVTPTHPRDGLTCSREGLTHCAQKVILELSDVEAKERVGGALLQRLRLRVDEALPVHSELLVISVSHRECGLCGGRGTQLDQLEVLAIELELEPFDDAIALCAFLHEPGDELLGIPVITGSRTRPKHPVVDVLDRARLDHQLVLECELDPMCGLGVAPSTQHPKRRHCELEKGRIVVAHSVAENELKTADEIEREVQLGPTAEPRVHREQVGGGEEDGGEELLDKPPRLAQLLGDGAQQLGATQVAHLEAARQALVRLLQRGEEGAQLLPELRTADELPMTDVHLDFERPASAENIRQPYHGVHRRP